MNQIVPKKRLRAQPLLLAGFGVFFFQSFCSGPLSSSLSFLALDFSSPGVHAQEVPFTKFQLPNGLTVILHEDHSTPLVTLNLWYHVGSKDEPPGRSGFAHLFEHLMFKGTDKFPSGTFDKLIEEAGGSNNATTSTDRTNYFESGPRELLETFIELEADRMEAVGRCMTMEKLDGESPEKPGERQVVRNERRQRYENRPYGMADLAIPKQIYPEGHPYREPVIGSHEELEAATVDDVKDFFEKFYFARNATLVLAGDFDSAEARRLVEANFGPLATRPPLERVKPAPPRIEQPVRLDLTDRVGLPLVTIVWHSPAILTPGDADMDILASALSDGKSSRLYRSLVYEKKLAQDIRVYQMSMHLSSQFRIYAFARPGVDLDELEAAIDAEIEKLQADGPTEREIARARNKFERLFWNSVQSLSDRADLLNRYQFHLNDPNGIARDLGRYEAITPASAKKWAEKVLTKSSRLILRVLPEKTDGAASP